ncbi:MAG: DNRLRE domain-containing protein [candidate division WOR-3 bacterium]
MRTLGITVLLFLACNTLPVGFDQLTNLPETGTLELLPESLDSYGRYIPLGYADYLILGRDGQYESRILIKFPLKDSALDSVRSIRLVLHPIDSISVDFVIHACSTDWNTGAVTWVLADSATRWFTPGGDLWEFTLGTGRLAKESTVVELDRGYLHLLVRQSFGIVLIPGDTGFCAVTNMTDARAGPRLVLTYLNGRERVFYPSGDAHIVDSSHIRTSPGDLLVGSSFAFRTYLKFNLDTLPARATIIRAELSFIPQTLYRRTDTIHLGIHRLTESYPLRTRYAGYEENASALATCRPEADTTVTFEISRLVQQWISHSDSSPNYGFLLTAEPEWQRPFRLKILRSGSAAPRLKIHYVLPPSDRFSR